MYNRCAMKRAKIHFYKINGIVLFFLRIFMQKVLVPILHGKIGQCFKKIGTITHNFFPGSAPAY